MASNGANSSSQPDQQLRETRKRDAKALFLIQSALDDEIFPHIAAATTSNEAWETLKKEFLGEKKVLTVKLQTLRRELESLAVKGKEFVQEFLSRVCGVVSQMKSYGEDLSNETIMSKVLRSLTKDFDHVVAVIEELKDLSKYSFDELMGSLLAHEVRTSRSSNKADEKAFQKKGKYKFKAEKSTIKTQGRGGYHGRGSGRGRGRGQFGSRSNVQCHDCKKFRHKEFEC